jgi:hypothetical protein
MKIGLIGAPGAGKTKFAKALAKEYDLKVVDNYAQKIQKGTSLALGLWATHSENLMVAGTRLVAEYSVVQADTITVGTVIDSITYAAVKSDIAMSNNPESLRSMYSTAESAMMALSLILAETWEYHLAFYLPLDPDNIPEERWKQTLDSAYPVVLESFDPQYVYRLDGPHTQRLKLAKEIIDLATSTKESEKEAADSSPAQTDERSYGARTGDGESIGDAPISVPDL